MISTGVFSVTEEKMILLESELKQVLQKLKPLLDETGTDEIGSAEDRPIMSTEQKTALFNELEPLLKRREIKSGKLLPGLRAIPGTEELALQIEKIELGAAYRTLVKLRKEMEV